MVWCVLHAGDWVDRRRDERGVIHGRGCFTYDPSCIRRLVLSASARRFIWRGRYGLFGIAMQNGFHVIGTVLIIRFLFRRRGELRRFHGEMRPIASVSRR